MTGWRRVRLTLGVLALFGLLLSIGMETPTLAVVARRRASQPRRHVCIRAGDGNPYAVRIARKERQRSPSRDHTTAEAAAHMQMIGLQAGHLHRWCAPYREIKRYSLKLARER
jgi:hypothetical protein